MFSLRYTAPSFPERIWKIGFFFEHSKVKYDLFIYSFAQRVSNQSYKRLRRTSKIIQYSTLFA